MAVLCISRHLQRGEGDKKNKRRQSAARPTRGTPLRHHALTYYSKEGGGRETGARNHEEKPATCNTEYSVSSFKPGKTERIYTRHYCCLVVSSHRILVIWIRLLQGSSSEDLLDLCNNEKRKKPANTPNTAASSVTLKLHKMIQQQQQKTLRKATD